MKVLKPFTKPFETPQRSAEIKIQVETKQFLERIKTHHISTHYNESCDKKLLQN